MESTQETMTSGQAAILLGIPARTVRRYLVTGRLPGVQNPITGRWTVQRADVVGFLEAHTRRPIAPSAETPHPDTISP